jgi:hypothetical protein
MYRSSIPCWSALLAKEIIHGQKMTTRKPGKHEQVKDSAPQRDSQLAAGGELHQIAGGEHLALTTTQGVALSDNQNSLRANSRGPVFLNGLIFREKPCILITSGYQRQRRIYCRGKDTSMGPGKVRSNIGMTAGLVEFEGPKGLVDEP